MPPLMNTPAQGADFHGVTGTFYWWNGHGSNTPPHNARAAYQWRVKVGSSQYGFDYFLGYPVSGAQLYDPNVDLSTNTPPDGSTCWTVVEWKTSASSGWYAGSPTSFTFYK
jgi:hypothetical protein